jgi:hypothetical protein
VFRCALSDIGHSPGVVSALALFPSTRLILTGAALDERRISRRGAALSAVAVVRVHAAAVAQRVYGVGARRR